MKKIKILFIEDDAIELMKFQRVLENIEADHHIINANNGEEALTFLSKSDDFPNLIMVDLNMPKMNGITFLKTLKSDEKLKFLPVIIMTTSNNPKDVFECYSHSIAGYILKPLKYEDYVDRIKNILSYWACNELISNNK
jgi:CheY-like chemotaxis protein